MGSRASLVDAVLDLPELQGGTHLEATVPLGDAESLQRLEERTDGMTTRAAGSSALVDADLPDEQAERSEMIGAASASGAPGQHSLECRRSLPKVVYGR